MASLTIRNLDDELKTELRIQAAERGRSMEAEARQLLREALKTRRSAGQRPVVNLAEAIAARFDPLGGVELDLPPRTPDYEPLRFDWMDRDDEKQ